MLQTLLGAVISMLLGFLWYSPLMFARPWMTLMGMTAASMKDAQSKMGPLYILSFVAALFTSGVLRLIIRYIPDPTIPNSFIIAFLVWLGFVLPVQLTGEIFSGKPFKVKLLTINTLYQLVSLLAVSLVHSLWV